jgi:hypothetical protein
MNASSQPGIVQFPRPEKPEGEDHGTTPTLSNLPKRVERKSDDDRHKPQGIEVDLDDDIESDGTSLGNGQSVDARTAPQLAPETHPANSQDAIGWTTIDKTIVRCSPEVYYSSVWDFSSFYRNPGGAR